MSDGTGAIAWQIPRPKITRYLLDPTSKRGASKAKYLMGFGFAREDPDTLAKALVTHAKRNLPGVEAVSQIGVPVLVIEGVVTAPDGREMPLRTIWEPREPQEMHFITAVPLTR